MKPKIVKTLFSLSFVFSGLEFFSAFVPRKMPQEALEYFDAVFLEKAFSRASWNYALGGLRSLVFLGGLWAIYVFVRSPFWKKAALKLDGDLLRRGILGALLGLFIPFWFWVLTLPFNLFMGFFLEHKFDLSKMTLGSWLFMSLKDLLLEGALYAASGIFAVILFSFFPKRWKIASFFAYVIVTVFLTALYPGLIAPMQNEFHPLEDEELAFEIRALGHAAGIEVGSVKVMAASKKTGKVNAYFAGIGSTKEIVLYDTLVEGFPKEEVLSVVAHEMGHWRHNDVFKSVFLSAVAAAAFLSLYKTALSPKRSFKNMGAVMADLLVLSLLLGFLLSPLSCYLSRLNENRADLFALDLTNDPDSFISVQESLARSNLSDVAPPPFVFWFLSTHPSTLQRIKMARNYLNLGAKPFS